MRDTLKRGADDRSRSADGRTQMAGRWDATIVIDRTVAEVFAFLPDGENVGEGRDVDQEERCQSGRVDSHAGTT
jgi:hypothetical protein